MLSRWVCIFVLFKIKNSVFENPFLNFIRLLNQKLTSLNFPLLESEYLNSFYPYSIVLQKQSLRNEYQVLNCSCFQDFWKNDNQKLTKCPLGGEKTNPNHWSNLVVLFNQYSKVQCQWYFLLHFTQFGRALHWSPLLYFYLVIIEWHGQQQSFTIWR